MKVHEIDHNTATFKMSYLRTGESEPKEILVLGRILNQDESTVTVRYLNPSTLNHENITLEK